MAIAIDNSASTTTTTFSGTVTLAHTVNSNTNGILVVSCLQSSGDFITGATYAGIAMSGGTGTLKYNFNGAVFQYEFYIFTPASGANNVVISTSSNTGRIDVISASYTNARQSGFPDSVVTANVSGTSWNPSTTSIVDNCYGLLYTYYNAGGAYTFSGVTNRQQLAPTGDSSFSDSNAAIHPAGTFSPTATQGSSAPIGGFVMTMAPFIPNNSGFFMAAAR